MIRRAYPVSFALVCLLLAFAAAPARGGELRLAGEAVQGGLMRGFTEPGARVQVDGRRVRLAPDGGFIFGLGRDHPPELVVEARLADGRVERRRLAVRGRRYPEQRIDGVPQPMVTPPPAVRARIAADAAKVRAARANDDPGLYFRQGLRWPAIGPITGVYGSRRVLNGTPRAPHYGVDIKAPEGSLVAAAAAGTVRLAEALYLSGNTVIIDHGYGLTTSYLHLKALSVEAGERVAQGQPIGRVGATGRVTGAHLDWRLNWFNVRLDPALVAGPMPAAGDLLRDHPASAGEAKAIARGGRESSFRTGR